MTESTGSTGSTGTPGSIGSAFPRTLLFVPANRTDMFARAFASDAEAIIFDLEDAVPDANKEAARAALMSLDRPANFGRPIFVRLNVHGSEHFEQDLRAATSMRVAIAGVVLPKVERAAQVVAVDKAIANYEAPGRTLALILLIETPAGVMRVAELADCGVKRVVAFAFGTEDYRAGMRIDALDPALADFARSTVSNAAAAAGVAAIDSPFLQFDSPEVLRATVLHARALGFTAKFAIHPVQLSTIHDAFADRAVSGSIDRGWALRAMEAYERATRDGQGSVALDGRMIDEATMKRVREVLKS
jgi:citrate lyase subunit beta / citryl-CoA lyase